MHTTYRTRCTEKGSATGSHLKQHGAFILTEVEEIRIVVDIQQQLLLDYC